MKIILLFYSLTGHTRRLAEQIAAEEDAELCEVRELRKRTRLGAFTLGIIAAAGHKRSLIQTVNRELANYDRFIVMGPIWASLPAPAVNSILDLLPPGKEVDIRMVSDGGESQAKNVMTQIVQGKGCEVVAFTDLKTQKNGAKTDQK